MAYSIGDSREPLRVVSFPRLLFMGARPLIVLFYLLNSAYLESSWLGIMMLSDL